MNLKNKIISVLLFKSFCLPACFCQFILNEPVLIGKEQGLPTNDIRSIEKGKNGFIWLGTIEGLCRFDGREIKTYKPAETLNNHNSDNTVYSAIPVSEKIWMGTNYGVFVFNIRDESFRHYSISDNHNSDSIPSGYDQTVTLVYKDRQDEIWIGTRTQGVWKYEREKDEFRMIDYSGSSYKAITPVLGSRNTILSITQSAINDSIIWAGTVAGLQEINKYTGKISWYTYTHPQKNYQVSLNAFRRLYHHVDGLLYVGSWGAGVNVFDPMTKTFTPLQLNQQKGTDAIKGAIGGIRRKSENELWITASSGLSVYNTKRKEITWFWLNDISSERIFGIDYIDEANRIWLMTLKGLQYFDPVTQQFSNYTFAHLFDKGWAFAFYIKSDDGGNTITICPRVADGIFRFDKNNRSWSKFSFNGLAALGLENLLVRGFEEVSPGNYIISTDKGLYNYSLSNRILKSMPGQPDINFARWGEVIKSKSGEFWLAGDADGLVRWNLALGKFQIYKKELTNDGSGIGFIRPDHLFEDSRKNIWFSRDDGFSVHISGRDTIINFTTSANAENCFPVIHGFAEDRTGKIWVAARNGWYGYIDVNRPERGIIKKFNLSEKNIKGFFIKFATDKEGNVWGYTNQLLLRINASDQSLSSFNFSYGVKEPDFYHFSFLEDGEMIFGGRNGITLADISGLRRNKELPAPYISEIKVMNKSVNSSFINEGLDLRYKQNFITIFFSARAYTMANAVRFRYRLKNFDDWIEVAGVRSANYTNIPPGKYVFQLQAANNEGVWNQIMTELPVHIKKPWFLTWWFRIGFVLLIAGLIYWWYRYRINQIKKKEKLKTQYEKKLANVEMTALLAQMNPHFLFNSLNSIDSYIIKNESGKASEYLNNFARLMRLILQNSRSNYTSLKDEIELLELYMQMEGLRFKDKFSYEIKVQEGLDTASIMIPPMLIQPYIENAIWHGLMHKKDTTIGKVEVTISEKSNRLICIIEDNGIGRAKAEEIKAQKPGNHKRSMGMQITRDRIDLINKLYNTDTSVQVFDLKDKEGNASGTRVELIIPY